MPKYFAEPYHAKICRCVIPCQNISLNHTMPKYFSEQYHAKIFRCTKPCQNFTLYQTMPKYYALPNHAKTFCSAKPCQNISLKHTMPKYFDLPNHAKLLFIDVINIFYEVLPSAKQQHNIFQPSFTFCRLEKDLQPGLISS